jgi:thiamine kinase
MTEPNAGNFPSEVLERVSSLRGARVLETLVAGPVSDSWLLERDGERFTLRLDRPLAARLGLDRAAEWRFLEQAAGAGLGPEPLARGDRLLVTRYLPGEPWGVRDAPWFALGQLLRRVHETPAPQGKRFDLSAISARYAACAGGAEAARLAGRVRELAGPLYADSPGRLCHHDAHLGNVVGAAEPRLIDWEYAALGQPLFDLAVVIRHHGLDEDDTAALVAGWAGDAPPTDPERLAAYLDLYDVLVRLWALAVEPG